MWCWIPQNQGKSELEKEISAAFIKPLYNWGGFFFFFIRGNKLNSIRKEKREDANLIVRELRSLVKITVERELPANKFRIASVSHVLYYCNGKQGRGLLLSLHVDCTQVKKEKKNDSHLSCCL